MTEETEANLAEPENAAASTPAPEAESQSETVYNYTDDDDGSDEDEEDLDLIANPEPDEVEVEYEGGKHKIPAALKDAFLRDSDYRKKTMELAEQRREFEANAAKAQEKWAADETFFDNTIQLRRLEQQLEVSNQIDWDAWQQSDPMAAMRGLVELKQLQDQHQQVRQGIESHKQILERQNAESYEQSRQAALDNASKTIPNWSDEKLNQLENFGIEIGFDKSQVSQINDVKFLHLLHFGQIGRDAVNGRKAAAKNAAAQAGEPVARIKGKSGGVKKDPARMSDAELYADYQNRRKASLNG